VTLQVIPDIGFWQQGWASTYSAGDPIAAIWYGVWLAKWLAARTAEHALEHPSAAPGDAAQYRSGAIPHAFLAAATALLLVKLVTGEAEDRALFALGIATLAVLLVARQGVELRERDRLHRALKAEEERYRALLQHAFDAVLLVDALGHVRYASPATERVIGPSTWGEGWSFLAAAHPADADSIRHAFAAARRGPQEVTLRIRDQERQWRTFEATVQDLRDDARIGGWVVNALDRTREKQLADGLRGTQQLEALGVLASGLAHDLNNILTVIASHVELLADDRTLSAEALVDLKAIKLASDRAQALTQGLLTLSRRKGTSWGVVEVDPLVRERVARHGGALAPVDSPEVVAVRADAIALARVIDVVLEESVQGAPDTSRRVRTQQRDVGIGLARELHVEPGRFVVIAVGDAEGASTERVEPAVSTADDWNLAPGDLAMLMALASAREVGGTIVREHSGTSQRLAIYLPSAAA